MSYSLPHLVWLRAFEAAARHLSFAQAALELGLTPAAVSQQMRALETQLGFALFERLPRGVNLTTMGRAYLPSVRKALDELSVATNGLFGSRSRRPLTIRCAVSYAMLCLSPKLGEFRSLYPDIQIKLYASVWSDDLDDEKIDIDIRYGDGRWNGFDVERLSPPIAVPVCPPTMTFGRNPSVELLACVRTTPIYILGYENLWAQLGQSLGWPTTNFDNDIHVDTSLVALEMIAAGVGSAMISRELALRHHAAGRVSIPDGIELRYDQSHFLLVPRRRRAPSTEALVFRDWLSRITAHDRGD